jgi:hypothetical protein
MCYFFAILCPKFLESVKFLPFIVIVSRNMGICPFDMKCVKLAILCCTSLSNLVEGIFKSPKMCTSPLS